MKTCSTVLQFTPLHSPLGENEDQELRARQDAAWLNEGRADVCQLAGVTEPRQGTSRTQRLHGSATSRAETCHLGEARSRLPAVKPDITDQIS